MNNVKFGDKLRENSKNAIKSEENRVFSYIKENIYPEMERASLRGKTSYRFQISKLLDEYLYEHSNLVINLVKQDGLSAKFYQSDHKGSDACIIFSW